MVDFFIVFGAYVLYQNVRRQTFIFLNIFYLIHGLAGRYIELMPIDQIFIAIVSILLLLLGNQKSYKVHNNFIFTFWFELLENKVSLAFIYPPQHKV